MFSSTAYDAYFVSLGVYLHSNLTKFLTSNEFFRALLIFIAAVTLLVIGIQYFSRHLPGTFFEKRYVSLSKFFNFIICFFIAVSLLKIGSTVDVKNYDRKTWRDNPYLMDRLSKHDKDYQVSFIFDLMIRTIEEIGWGTTKLVDYLMAENHSNLKAPNFFYKSLLYAGASQIESPKLREKLEMYSTECVWKMLDNLPEENRNEDWLGKLHSAARLPDKITEIYSQIQFKREDGSTYTCNDLRFSVNQALYEESISEAPLYEKFLNESGLERKISASMMTNLEISSRLLNFYRSQRQNGIGIKKGSEIPGTFGSIIQYLSKLKSFEGLSRANNNDSIAGASLAVDKAREFNELQRKAPMIKGLVKMFLIGFAPLLAFMVIAMNWKILLWWAVAYSSVTIGWPFCWNLLYQLMTNFVASGSVLENMGQLSDSFSLLSAQLIMEDAYYFYTVIFWLQMASAIAVSGGALYFARGILSDNAEDHVPDIVPATANAALSLNGLGRMGR